MPRTATTFFALRRAFALVICLAWGTSAFGVEATGEVLFEWDPIEGAESYRLEISEKGDFKKLSQSFDLTDTRKEVRLKYDKKFFWRVAGKTFLGDLGEWSEPAEISVASPPKPKVEIAEAPKTPPARPVITKTYLVKRAKYPMWVRAGASGYYHFENVKGDGYSINNSGIPAGKLNLALGISAEKSELEGRLSYQKLSYTVLNSTLPELQEEMSTTYFSATALWRSPFKALGYTITMGGSFKQRPTFAQPLPETLTIEPMGAVSFLGGLSSFSRLSAPWYFKWEVLGEISPLGDWQGAGLNIEGTIGYTTGKFAPELVFGINPLYYATPQTKSAFQCDFNIGLLLKWTFGFGEGKPVVRTKVIEGSPEPQKTKSPPATDSPPSFGPPSPAPSG